MKVFHIFDHSLPLHSGYTFRSRNIIDQQRALGIETYHLTGTKHKQQIYQADEQVDDLLFYRTPASNSLLNRLPVINQYAVVTDTAKRLDRLVLEHKPDILHAHSPALDGLAALKIGKKYKIPVVYECRAFWEDAAVDHGTQKEGSLRYKLTRMMETYVFKNADAVTVICEGLKNDVMDREVPESKITVIPNAVDINKFETITEKSSRLAQNLGLGDELIIGFIGSFYAYEGLDLLVKATEQLLADGVSVKLLMVGGGPQDAALKQQVADAGIAQHVVFTGRVPHEAVNDYYSLIDLLIYPRKSMRLTDLVTPLKPLETMALGKLVIASDVGGHKELIDDGKTGFLFPADDVDALVDTIKKVDQLNDLDTIRKAGRYYVDNERNWGNSVKRYLPLYESLVK